MLAALVLFTYFVQRDDSLANALYEDIAANSPFNIAKTTVISTLVWLLAAATIAGDAAARDVSTRMHPLVYTRAITKAEYVGGRFTAAFAINALLLLGVQLAIVAAVYSPEADAMRMGPFRVAAYLTAYAFIALPTAFVGTALQFAFGLRSGRPMASYAGSILLLFMSFFIASFLLYQRALGTLLDPIGMRLIIEDIAHRWTTVEQNTRLLTLDGIVLQNRLLWVGVGAATFSAALFRFQFAHRVERAPWWRHAFRRFTTHAPTPTMAREAQPSIAIPSAPRSFGIRARLLSTLAIARDSFGSIAKSWAGLFMLGVIPLLTILIVLDQMTALGTPLVPVTGQVIKVLTAPISAELSRWVIVPLLSIYFAGELVWRERDAGLSEIDDASPVPEWVPLLAKFAGLGLMLAAFITTLAISGMIAQSIMGYHDFELDLYAKTLLGFQLAEYLVFAALAFLIHVVVDQKYIGHLVAVVAYGLILLAPMFGIEHNLLIYDGGPWWSYTEMRGLGPFVRPWLWSKLYWGAWALLLGVIACLFWVRGRENGLDMRLRLARRRFVGQTAGLAAASGTLIVVLGSYIFYNTNVLNEHLSASDLARRSGEYERQYGRFADAPQPRMTNAALRVDIHPERGAVDVAGTYRLVNRTGIAIDSIHIDLARGADSIFFDRPATRVLVDDTLHRSIYALQQALQPGDSVGLSFRMRVAPRGFRDRGADVSITKNATLFTDVWLPAIGYQRSRELLTPSDRRRYGLRERPVIPSLYDEGARKDEVRGGISLDVVMSTSEDQVAVAPGELRRSWTEGGRRYFHYSTPAPIGNEWTFASAHYETRDLRWKDVAINVLHHPEHTRHLDRLIEGVKASLDYYSAQFGPYPYGQLTVLEVPGDGVGIHADASMLTHGEGITYLQPRLGRLDLPYAVAGHEMGHEWNIPAAFVEGAPVMSESVAWYQAIQLVEHTKGPAERRRLLAFMRRPYPYAPIHRGEPLLRAVDPYMSYRKGPFALYLMSDVLGEAQVNGVLRRLWRTHTRSGAPLATTLDLYRGLQSVTPDSLQPLLHDLFEVNTYWTFATESPRAEPSADGTWRVTLHLRARKSVVDSAGIEKAMPMNDWVEIGVFGEAAKDDKLANALYLEKRRIASGTSTITVTVPGKPTLAGVDPFHLLDWEEAEDDDNVKPVTVVPSRATRTTPSANHPARLTRRHDGGA